MTSVVVKDIKIEGGKVKPKPKRKSVSERIREKKSKRVKVIRKQGEH